MMSRAQPLARPETWWYASARREPPRFDGKKCSPSVDIFSNTVKSFPILLLYYVAKVQIFLEGHKIMRNLQTTF